MRGRARPSGLRAQWFYALHKLLPLRAVLDASWSKNTLLNLDQGRAAAADARHSDEHRNSMDTDAITKAVTSLV